MHMCLFDKPIESLLFLLVLFMFFSHVDCAVVNLAKLDSAIHRMNLYALDRAIGFSNTYPL